MQNILPDYVLVLFVFAIRSFPTAIHDRGIYVGWTVSVWLVQQGYH